MSTILLDSDQIAELCKTSEGFALDQSAEESLVKLLDIQDQINKFVEEVKTKIAENASKVEPDFTSISGDRVKLEYRSFGAEFEMENEDLVDTMFKNYKPPKAEIDTKAVKEYLKLTGNLPLGIKQRERKKTLIIKRKGEQ